MKMPNNFTMYTIHKFNKNIVIGGVYTNTKSYKNNRIEKMLMKEYIVIKTPGV